MLQTLCLFQRWIKRWTPFTGGREAQASTFGSIWFRKGNFVTPGEPKPIFGCWSLLCRARLMLPLLAPLSAHNSSLLSSHPKLFLPPELHPQLGASVSHPRQRLENEGALLRKIWLAVRGSFMWGEQREDRCEKQAKGTFLTGFVQKERM